MFLKCMRLLRRTVNLRFHYDFSFIRVNWGRLQIRFDLVLGRGLRHGTMQLLTVFCSAGLRKCSGKFHSSIIRRDLVNKMWSGILRSYVFAAAELGIRHEVGNFLICFLLFFDSFRTLFDLVSYGISKVIRSPSPCSGSDTSRCTTQHTAEHAQYIALPCGYSSTRR